jgi:phosphate transport system substrate-binding protein
MNSRAGVCALAFMVMLTACSRGGTGRTAPDRATVVRPGASDHAVLTGSGASLAGAVVKQWAQQYRAIAPGVTIDFRAAASDAALDQQLHDGAVDFGLSEVPAELGQGMDGKAAVPSVASAVVVAYNVAGFAGLHLSAVTLARIFSGAPMSWNDASIVADNPGRALPSLRITPITRTDPSSATLVFTRYLQAAIPGLWTVAAGLTVRWQGGTGVLGPDAMIAAIRQRPGAVGYAAAADVRDTGLGEALVKNSSGHFAGPTAAAMDGYLIGGSGSPDDLTLAVPYDTPATDVYPLSAFSYLVVPDTAPGTDKAVALRNFLRWALTDGQRAVDRVGAAPVPLPLLVRTLEALQSEDLRPRR